MSTVPRCYILHCAMMEYVQKCRVLHFGYILTFMTFHVCFVMRGLSKPFSTRTTEVWIFSRVVLNMTIKSKFSGKCFVTIVTPEHSHFCTQATSKRPLLQKLFPLISYLLSELDMEHGDKLIMNKSIKT